MAVAGDVPSKYDLVLDDEGYVLFDGYRGDADVPSKAVHAFSTAFIPRTNIEGNYGDDKQDFWMTFSQKDWSAGEQQRNAVGEDNSPNRYWVGVSVDVSVPGQVKTRRAISASTFAANVRAVAPRGEASSLIYAAGTTNLYDITDTGTITDRGAHGLGAAPSAFGLTSDANDLYISTAAAGTVGVRKWDTGSFTTFSATGADSLAILNNSLYGLNTTTSVLHRYDSAGAVTTLFTWRAADGAALGLHPRSMRAYGGKLVILWGGGILGGELWLFDGTAPAKIAQFPLNFFAHDMAVALGNIYVSGSFIQTAPSSQLTATPAIYYYAGGNIGLLWKSSSSFTIATPSNIDISNHPAITDWDEGIIFTDEPSLSFMYYNAATGGVSTFGTYTTGGSMPLLASSQRAMLHTRTSTGAFLFPASTVATTSSVTSSLIDFDSSLNKLFRGIKIDFVAGSDGNGGSVDIAYRVGDVDGAYTTLQTGAVSGTEYTLTGVSGRSISVKITLNKGTSTNGPILKRVYVRAVPLKNHYHIANYILNLSGRNGDSPLVLRDGTHHPKDGLEMAEDLRMAAEAEAPFNITDKFETFAGIIDELELHEIRPEEFIAFVKVRQV